MHNIASLTTTVSGSGNATVPPPPGGVPSVGPSVNHIGAAHGDTSTQRYLELVGKRFDAIRGIIDTFEGSDRDSALIDAVEHPQPVAGSSGLAATWQQRGHLTAACQPIPPEVWQSIGSRADRDWLRSELESWTQRVMERTQLDDEAQRQLADHTSRQGNKVVGFVGNAATRVGSAAATADGEAERFTDDIVEGTTAFGIDYRQCVRRLRDVGIKLLHLASLGEKRSLAPEALRREVDSSVSLLAAAPSSSSPQHQNGSESLSSVVDRGLRASKAQIEVHTNEVHRSHATQQRLIQKLSVQVAQQEALVATLQRESELEHEHVLRLEEQLRQVTLHAARSAAGTNKRHKAVECHLATAPTVATATQTDDDGDVADTSSPLMKTISSGGSASSSSVIDRRLSSVTSNLRSLGGGGGLGVHRASSISAGVSLQPHEVFLLENRVQQQRFMFAAMVALYRKALRCRPRTTQVVTRTTASQTNLAPEWRSEQNACRRFGSEVLNYLDGFPPPNAAPSSTTACVDARTKQLLEEFSLSITSALDAVMISTPAVDLTDLRARAVSTADRIGRLAVAPAPVDEGPGSHPSGTPQQQPSNGSFDDHLPVNGMRRSPTNALLNVNPSSSSTLSMQRSNGAKGGHAQQQQKVTAATEGLGELLMTPTAELRQRNSSTAADAVPSAWVVSEPTSSGAATMAMEAIPPSAATMREKHREPPHIQTASSSSVRHHHSVVGATGGGREMMSSGGSPRGAVPPALQGRSELAIEPSTPVVPVVLSVAPTTSSSTSTASAAVAAPTTAVGSLSRLPSANLAKLQSMRLTISTSSQTTSTPHLEVEVQTDTNTLEVRHGGCSVGAQTDTDHVDVVAVMHPSCSRETAATSPMGEGSLPLRAAYQPTMTMELTAAATQTDPVYLMPSYLIHNGDGYDPSTEASHRDHHDALHDDDDEVDGEGAADYRAEEHLQGGAEAAADDIVAVTRPAPVQTLGGKDRAHPHNHNHQRHQNASDVVVPLRVTQAHHPSSSFRGGGGSGATARSHVTPSSTTMAMDADAMARWSALMERHALSVAEFEAYAVELRDRQQRHAERILVAPSEEISSHHFELQRPPPPPQDGTNSNKLMNLRTTTIPVKLPTPPIAVLEAAAAAAVAAEGRSPFAPPPTVPSPTLLACEVTPRGLQPRPTATTAASNRTLPQTTRPTSGSRRVVAPTRPVSAGVPPPPRPVRPPSSSATFHIPNFD